VRYGALDTQRQIHEQAHAFQVVLDIQVGIWNEIYLGDFGLSQYCDHRWGVKVLPQAAET
ncbi:unnamed protein product, partial [Bubo scandiacus]